MLKYVAPLESRLRHILRTTSPRERPHLFRAHLVTEEQSPVATGQRVAERVAALVGSWPFIIGQGVFLACWFLLNVLPLVTHWDPYPWMAANIVMSAEAAFTGPILLIAANVGAIRDHQQYDRIEHLAERIDTLEERILDRLAAIEARQSGSTGGESNG